MAAARLGPIVEIGSYCGRSTLYLAQGARAAGARVVAIDHHRGSEEHQPGGGFDDPALWDGQAGAVDTLPALRRHLRQAGVEGVVVTVVAPAGVAASVFPLTPGMVFIDGGHSMGAALEDWRAWGPRVALGGTLAVHDVYPDPRDGGRPPTEVYRRAVASGLLDPLRRVGSLAMLTRIG